MLKLIDGLRKATEMLEDNSVPYTWDKYSICNCGIVAQAILNINSLGLMRLIMKFDFTLKDHGLGMPEFWGGKADGAIDYCSKTGLPLPELFASLLSSGMKISDIDHLENLSDIKIRKAAGMNDETMWEDHKKKESVIQYLKGWISLLEAEAQKVEAVPVEEFELVGV